MIFKPSARLARTREHWHHYPSCTSRCRGHKRLDEPSTWVYCSCVSIGETWLYVYIVWCSYSSCAYQVYLSMRHDQSSSFYFFVDLRHGSEQPPSCLGPSSDQGNQTFHGKVGLPSRLSGCLGFGALTLSWKLQAHGGAQRITSCAPKRRTIFNGVNVKHNPSMRQSATFSCIWARQVSALRFESRDACHSVMLSSCYYFEFKLYRSEKIEVQNGSKKCIIQIDCFWDTLQQPSMIGLHSLTHGLCLEIGYPGYPQNFDGWSSSSPFKLP